MAIHGRPQRQIFSEINITPLTDIFLVLLIIMMVVAPMLDTSGLKVNVPSIAPSEEAKEDPKVIRVQINAQNQFTIDGKTVPVTNLATELQSRKKDSPDGVVIQLDPDSTHEALAMGMDAVQQVGMNLAVTESQSEKAAEELSKLGGE